MSVVPIEPMKDEKHLGFWGLGFRAQGLGLRVYGLGLRVWGVGLGFRV